MQWQIFDRPSTATCTVVLIGDPKQAIYAFRGGDVDLPAAAGTPATAAPWRSTGAGTRRWSTALGATRRRRARGPRIAVRPMPPPRRQPPGGPAGRSAASACASTPATAVERRRPGQSPDRPGRRHDRRGPRGRLAELWLQHPYDGPAGRRRRHRGAGRRASSRADLVRRRSPPAGCPGPRRWQQHPCQPGRRRVAQAVRGDGAPARSALVRAAALTDCSGTPPQPRGRRRPGDRRRRHAGARLADLLGRRGMAAVVVSVADGT